MPQPICPNCSSEYVYKDQSLLICPECAYEWNPDEQECFSVCDANGAKLEVGDKVMCIKDLKIKGSSQVLKVGAKASIKRILEGKDHQLDCKLSGVGEMLISAKYVKKA